jgi:hypothetical protein
MKERGPRCCSGFSWRFVLVISCVLAGMLRVEAGAQSLPGFSYFSGSQMSVSPLSVGLFYGIGSIQADHNLSAGPAFTSVWSVGPDFNAFVHHRKTELNDFFVSMESGIQRAGIEILNARVETNFGRVSKFRQNTDAAAGRRQTNLLIFLEDNQEGVITRDTKNRIWDIELTARFPITSLGELVAGYKFNSVNSDIQPYSSGIYWVPKPPPDPSVLFPGLSGWGPYVLDADDPPLPNSEQFKMVEEFQWQGLFVGMRFNNLALGLEGSRGYLEVIGSPCMWGRYEFSWNTGFTGVVGSGKASQATKINPTSNWFVEVRSGARFPLMASLDCDLFLKYSYIKMNFSGAENQSVDLEWPDDSWANAIYAQQANQSINVRQDFFGAGASLVASF